MMQDPPATPDEFEEVHPASSAPKRRSLLDDRLARVVQDVQDPDTEVEEKMEIQEQKQDKDEKPEARFLLLNCFFELKSVRQVWVSFADGGTSSKAYQVEKGHVAGGSCSH